MVQDSEAKRCAKWLKSLPERFNLQPKQEWDEEDEKTIHDACIWLDEYARFLHSKNKDKANMLFRLSDRLKSLRPQPRFVLDESDIWAIEQAIEDNDDPECEKHQNALKKLYEKIKSASLSSWKPSEEQMEVLGYAADGRTLKTEGRNVLESLYNDLKKL